MEIGQQKVGEVVVIAPTGHLDSKSSPELESLLVELLNEGRKRYLVDFCGVETISSAALRVLLMFTRRLKTADGSLALSSLNSHVRQVFDISGFTGSFQISESRRAALASLGPAEGRAETTARRAAATLGVETQPAAGARSDSGGDSCSVAATGALALEILRRAGSESTSTEANRSQPASPAIEQPPNDLLLGVAGGAGGGGQGPEVPATAGLWRRLRRHLDTRRH